ncbi:MAG: hypothetical protein ACHQNE_00140, partial [Candidatus Kapaibacterium sp.]
MSIGRDTSYSFKFGQEGLFKIGQESIPTNDSGGRWIRTVVTVTSESNFPIHVFGFPTQWTDSNEYLCAPILSLKADDSAWLRADSLLVDISYNAGNSGMVFSAGTPWKFRDSLPPLSFGQTYGPEILEYVVPPYETIRIPYLIQDIGPYRLNANDTDDLAGRFWVIPYTFGERPFWFSDSTTGSSNHVFRREPEYEDMGEAPIYAFAASSVPYSLSYKGNWTITTVLGGIPRKVDFQDTVMPFQNTKAKFEIVGEYDTAFDPPSDTTIPAYCYSYTFPDISWTFRGAPKPVVHDTLVSTFTDAWGSIITRNPIEAYTDVDVNSYVTYPSYHIVTAPFLGSAKDTAKVFNLSDFPVTLKNLHMQNYGTQISFEIASYPTVIAAHDSGFIIVELVDNDLERDLSDPTRSATLTGYVLPYQSALPAVDTGSFSIALNGLIDVYSPEPVHYFYTPPKLQHGIHPTGIVFSSTISSNAGPGTFLTFYGNHDSATEYFYTPYYDDPHFAIAIGNFDGLSTISLPGPVQPVGLNLNAVIEALTTFTGDTHQNYRTQLHWPRAHDTISIDVVALGALAPPFDGVKSIPLSNSLSVWPNPASQVIHIYNPDQSPIWISDALG